MNPYGCHNRKPLRDKLTVQDGWEVVMGRNPDFTRMPRLTVVPVPMSKDCKHTQDAPNDPRCDGCKWRKQ